jgi:hypothetical protein
MANLSERAKQWLEDSNCFEEISDDVLSLANTGIQILLSAKAVVDLNRQARDAQDT